MASEIHSSWSDIPAEIAHEIAGHNADDVETLRAMALASKTTRSVAIRHLFSSVHFACVEDFSQWLDMLSRTPMLNSVVKKVKFSNYNWALLRRRELTSATEFLASTTAPVIPPLPTVHSVKWDYINLTYGPPSGMIVAHMALFPNIEHLRLCNMQINYAALTHVFRACRQLRSLSFQVVYERDSDSVDSDSEESVDSDSGTDSGGGSDPISDPQAQFRRVRSGRAERPRQGPFGLIALRELVIVDCAYQGSKAVLSLTRHSQPTRLKTLSLGDSFRELPCSVQGAEKLLRFSAVSLVNLVVDPKFPDADTHELVGMLDRLPAFMALETLTLWIGPYNSAATFINGLTAPNLTRLIFRRILYHGRAGVVRRELEDILRDILSWHTSESMGTFFARKFPRCQQIEFHFCIVRNPDIHFRRGLRRKVERRLKDRLEDSGADIAELVRVEWLDEECNPVRYNKTNGKPPWKWGHSHKEPESEASDCESDNDDSD